MIQRTELPDFGLIHGLPSGVGAIKSARTPIYVAFLSYRMGTTMQIFGWVSRVFFRNFNVNRICLTE